MTIYKFGSDDKDWTVDLTPAAKIHENNVPNANVTDMRISNKLVNTAPAPATLVDTGDTGQISFDTDDVYFCTATDTWKSLSLNNIVDGPASSTDKSIAVFDGTTGTLLKNSNINTYDGNGWLELESFGLGASAQLRLSADTGEDAYVRFIENNTFRWDIFTDGSDNNSLNFGITGGQVALSFDRGTRVGTFEKFPITPSAAPTTDYQVANKKYVDDNSSVHANSRTKSITIESPVNDDKITMFRVLEAMTIKSVHAVVVGTTPSVLFSIQYTVNVGGEPIGLLDAQGHTCTSTTTGESWTTGFENPTFSLNSWVVIYIHTVTGTVDSISITVEY